MEWITRLLMRAYDMKGSTSGWSSTKRSVITITVIFFRIKLSLASKNFILTVQ